MNYYNYFTEIEEHFVKRRGKHLLVSPIDWSLIATWRESGIPLHIALRGIDRAMDAFHARPQRSGSKVSSLFYCHDSVMTEHTGYLESRVGVSSAEGAEPGELGGGKGGDHGPDKKSIMEFMEIKIHEIEELERKHTLVEEAAASVERVLIRLKEILASLGEEQGAEFESLERDLGILDEILVSGLRTAIPAEKMAEWEQEAKRDLKIYRKRLPKETYAKILDNFLRSKVHRWFDIGELSLFHL